MGRVEASVSCRVSVHEAQTGWCDTTRWAAWVEGLDEVLSVSPGWPEPGSFARWRSGPAGRGSVQERILAYVPLRSVELEVEDDQTVGRELVTFAPADGGCEIDVQLAYRLRRRIPALTAAFDWLFVKRVMEGSLRSMLGRFAVELESRSRSGTSD